MAHYGPQFAWLYGLAPWDVERLTVRQFATFAAWADNPANYGMRPDARV